MIDRLDDAPVRRLAAHRQPRLLHGLAEPVVKLVAMAVPLPNLRHAVGLVHHGAGQHAAGIGAQSHGAALGDAVVLVGHKINHQMPAAARKLAGVGVRKAQHMPRKLNDADLHAQANAKVGNMALPRIAAGADHALDAPVAESARNQNAVAGAQKVRRVRLRHLFALHPGNLHARPALKPRVRQRLGDGQVRVVQPDVFAHNGDAHGLAHGMDTAHHLRPGAQVGLGGLQAEQAADRPVQPLAVQHQRGFIERGKGLVFNDAIRPDVAKQRNLGAQLLVQRLVHARHDDVRRQAQRLHLADGMLRGLGFMLARRLQEGHQRHMRKQAVAPADLRGELPDGLQKRLALDVADRAADFRNQHVRV